MLKKSNLSVIEIAQIVGHTTTQMIIKHYAKYIKDEHLRIDRNIKLF
jgi:integrase